MRTYMCVECWRVDKFGFPSSETHPGKKSWLSQDFLLIIRGRSVELSIYVLFSAHPSQKKSLLIKESRFFFLCCTLHSLLWTKSMHCLYESQTVASHPTQYWTTNIRITLSLVHIHEKIGRNRFIA